MVTKLRLLKVKSLKEGRGLLVELMRDLGLNKTEEVLLEDSLGRILAQEIVAREDIPSFNRSSVDGFALKSSNTQGASDSLPTVLTVIEDIAMGAVPTKVVGAGQASRLMTGGMLPEGADAMVMIENTEIMGELLAVYKPARAFDHVVEIGEDSPKGQLYFSPGTRVSPRVVASLASLGYDRVRVYRRPSLYIVSTGDELLDLGEELVPGKTRDVNGFSVEALAQDLGFEVLGKTRVADDRQELTEALAYEADFIMVSGSSSQGDRDYLASIVSKMEPGLLFHGLSIKPGKPTILASDGKKVILGLPGHPVSSFIVFMALVEEAFRDYYGMGDKLFVEARLSHNMAATPGRTLYQPAELDYKDGELWARPIFGASGSLSVLARAQGYFILEDREEGVVGQDLVQVYPLD